MLPLNERLREISELNRQEKSVESESQLLKVIDELSREELQNHLLELQQVIAKFLPKRRRNLTSALNGRLATPAIATAFTGYDALRERLRDRLQALCEQHIFQWATFYRDAVGEVFDEFMVEVKRTPASAEVVDIIREGFARHTTDIFMKGFLHQLGQQLDPEAVFAKQIAGLGRFLELPVSCYLATSTATADASSAWNARVVCSAILAGILQGFGQTTFGEQSGWQILPRDVTAKRWAHCIPFLCLEHLTLIVNQLAPGEFVDATVYGVMPIAKAVDRLLHEDSKCIFPLVGEYKTLNRGTRLVIVLAIPAATSGTQTAEIHCLLNRSSLDRYQLEESASRGVTLIVASLRPELEEWVETHDLLRQQVVNSLPTLRGNADATSDKVYQHLAADMATRLKSDSGAVVAYNYAKDFPLEKPSWKKFFFIQRPSVRNLLRSFEQTTGVHLWCSVRRSGKTTAGFDLSSTIGGAVVVSQTCDSTGERPDDDAFYKRFTVALDSQRRLPSTFFADSVAACVQNPKRADDKIIFILDEYETLFGQLHLAVQDDPGARYNIVQPLLNQMVRFSRDNLLVLIGMRPDAHYIIMDQNQLSPCIEQDHFPLFEHSSDATASEFHNLLKRVVSNRAEIEPAFADSFYAETGGHPYLTINLFVELFDWLIKRRWPAAPLRLTSDLFVEFAADKLTLSAIRQSTNYDFMRKFIRGGLASESRNQQPWLYSVLATLQQIGRDAPQSLAVSRLQAGEMIQRLGLQTLGIDDPDSLLRTGAQANFFSIDGDCVRPRIPLLARIAHSIPAP